MTDIAAVERQVLGAMLLSPTAIDDVSAVVTAGDYAEPRHEAIHAAIAALHGHGKPVDPVTVADHLGSDLRRVGGATYLHECVATVATPRSAEYHAGLVRNASTLRKVAAVAVRLDELARIDGTSTETVIDAVNAARSHLDALVTADAHDVPNEQAVYDAIGSLEQPVGIAPPWSGLRNCISGWSPGWLYIAGARPGVGKSVMAIGVALDVARRGKTAVLYSLEMPRTDLYLRMLSAVGSVDGQRILHRNMGKPEEEQMARAAAQVARLPLIVDDRSGLSLAQMRAHLRHVQRTRDVGVVVVDYLGLVKPPPDAPRHDRRVQVDAIAQGLKELARDCGVPVVALSQLNRAIESRAEKMPTLSDLRESGGIEAAADVVLLMHRGRAADGADESDLLVSVAKNRHGPQLLFHLDFQGRYSRIVDPDLRATTWSERAS